MAISSGKISFTFSFETMEQTSFSDVEFVRKKSEPAVNDSSQMREGTVVDASLIAAPPSTKNPDKDRDDVWALTELCNSLGFDRLRQVFRRTLRAIDIAALMRVMGLRWCEPGSKLGVCPWVETVTFPGIIAEKMHHQLLRAMDAMVEHLDGVDQFSLVCCAPWSIRILQLRSTT